MRKYVNIANKKRKSAALIIALIIISIVGIVVVATGREVVSGTFASTRYPNSVIAEQAAWAGIEDGLIRLKNSTTTGAYFPTFDATTLSKVIRRNLSQPAGTTDEVAGAVGGVLGIDPGIDLENSCDDTTGVKCNKANWDMSDKYYDVRVSSSDDVVIPETHPINAVNMSGITSLKKESRYYQVPMSGSGTSYKFLDMQKYSGTTITGGAYPSNNTYQRMGLYFDMGVPLATGESVVLESFAKYAPNNVDRDWDGDLMHVAEAKENAYLECYDPHNPAGYWGSANYYAEGNYFYNRYTVPVGTASQTMINYIPRPCGLTSFTAGTVETFILKISYTISTPKTFNFGLRSITTGSGSGITWWSNPSSFIGTGLTKLISTGIYGNTRKTVEVGAYKKIRFNDAVWKERDSNQLSCDPTGLTTLNSCAIAVYRDSKY